jgi:hypothetical protein
LIDTLKMARALEKAGLNREGAEEVAEELRDQIDRKYVTRDYLDSRLDSLYWKVMAGVAAMLFGHFIAVWLYIGSRVGAIEAALAKLGH